MTDPEPPTETGPTGAELAELVGRVGGRVLRRTRLWSGREAAEVVVPSHKAKVELLALLARWDSRRPRVIELARGIAARTRGGPEKIARALHEWILATVRFAPEPRELFRATERTIADRYGDCDDAARALLALYLAAGLRGGLATLGSPPTHVAVCVELGDRWLWAEPTIPGAQLGEHPRAALRRTLRRRPDLGQAPDADRSAELRSAIVEYAALAGIALGARAAWDRRWPTPEEIALAVTTGAWSPMVILGVRSLWARWTTRPEPATPEPIEPEPEPET